ncbi:MAG TPA: methyltransferase domain-containing protein [Terriglobales bacterium]|nr:methyltransferase domain-containing protein [Terriglobales bacterium]
MPPRIRKVLFTAFLLLAGCASLEQCAYEGVGRDQWQQPQKIIDTLQIRPESIVADLGAGGGYFTFRLADAVGPSGKIYAVDIDVEMTDLIKGRAQKEARTNIQPILAKSGDPLLPSAVDLIFTTNTYHHIDNRIAYFANLKKYL